MTDWPLTPTPCPEGWTETQLWRAERNGYVVEVFERVLAVGDYLDVVVLRRVTLNDHLVEEEQVTTACIAVAPVGHRIRTGVVGVKPPMDPGEEVISSVTRIEYNTLLWERSFVSPAVPPLVTNAIVPCKFCKGSRKVFNKPRSDKPGGKWAESACPRCAGNTNNRAGRRARSARGPRAGT